MLTRSCCIGGIAIAIAPKLFLVSYTDIVAVSLYLYRKYGNVMITTLLQVNKARPTVLSLLDKRHRTSNEGGKQKPTVDVDTIDVWKIHG